MKLLISILFAFVLFSQNLPSQTELWHTPYGQTRIDEQGNVYVGSVPQFQTTPVPDTLIKVNSNGVLLWKSPIPHLSQIFYSGSGIFTASDDSVTYYSPQGVRVWGIQLHNIVRNISPQGNLFLVTGTTGSFKLMMLTPSQRGKGGWVAPIPSPIVPNQTAATFNGVFADEERIWTVGLFSSQTITDDGNGNHYENFTDLSQASIFRNNGSLVSQKIIWTETYHELQQNADGSSTSTDNYSYYSYFDFNFSLVQNKLVGWDSPTMVYATTDNLGNTKMRASSKWRLISIDPRTLNTNVFQYGGNGYDSTGDQNNYLVGDDGYNVLMGVTFHDNIAYMAGQIINGKGINSVGTLTVDAAIEKFNIATNTVPQTPPNGQRIYTNQGWILTPGYKPGRGLVIRDPVSPNVIHILDPNTLADIQTINFPVTNLYVGNIVDKAINILYLYYMDPTTFDYRFGKFDIGFPHDKHKAATAQTGLPHEFALQQNYPNPFNPTTTLRFDLPVQSQVTLKVYNMLGQEVAAVLNAEQLDAGVHEVEFNGSNLASGVYTYRIEATGNDGKSGTFTQIKRMILVK